MASSQYVGDLEDGGVVICGLIKPAFSYRVKKSIILKSLKN